MSSIGGWLSPRAPRNRTRRGTNIVAEVQSPNTRSRRCCETMIFVLSSFIRLSEPTSRGTVTGQRTSRARLRASCPTSRTSEHSSAGATGCDVRMFTIGWAAPRRRSVCRTANVLAPKSLLGLLQLLVAYAAVLSLYFIGTFISYLSPTLEVKAALRTPGAEHLHR